MAEAAHEEPQHRFLIPVRSRWKLWIPPVLAILSFAFVIVVVLARVDLGIPDQERTLVLGALGVFAFLVLWMLLLVPRVRVRTKKTKKAKKTRRDRAAASAPAEPQVLETEPEVEPETVHAPAYAPEPTRPAGGLDVEYRVTGEDRQGLRVIEVSVPPKSQNRGAIYSKAFVTVDDKFAIRIEDLVATPAELQAES